MADETPLVMTRDDGAVRILTLNRGARRNPLSSAMIAALRAALAEIAASSHIRCVVLAAEGPAFCAGHDLKEIQTARAAPDHGRAVFTALMRDCAALMLAIRELPVPVMAAIEGIATAAGCQLVATCDLAIAGNAARFATPGVHIGLFCSTPMVALSRNVTNKHAMEMLLTGEMIDAETAHRFGLVNRVVPDGHALPQALLLAQSIAAKPSATIKIGKQAFYRQREMPLDDAYAFTAQVMVENLLHKEAVEGISAFVGKGRPST